MKIYVASRWEDRETTQEAMKTLISAGHTITTDWTTHDYPEKDVHKHLQEYAIADIEGVKNADVVVLLAISTPDYRGGATGEMTAAIALGKQVYLIGHSMDGCIFTNHPLVRRINSIEECLKSVRKPPWQK